MQDRLECIILIVKKRLTKEYVRRGEDGNVRKNFNVQRYDKRLVRKQQRSYNSGVMYYFSPILDFVITTIFVFVFLFFLSIGVFWSIIRWPFEKIDEFVQKFHT